MTNPLILASINNIITYPLNLDTTINWQALHTQLDSDDSQQTFTRQALDKARHELNLAEQADRGKQSLWPMARKHKELMPAIDLFEEKIVKHLREAFDQLVLGWADVLSDDPAGV